MSAPIPITPVLASRNRKKSIEVRRLLRWHAIGVASLADFPDVPEVLEDGQTFTQNAAKKAQQVARHLKRWAIGEDSGLVVDALDGRPGIFSARYSGPDATDASNNARLLADLEGVPHERRTAHYVCHAAVSDPQGTIRLAVEETCHGRILTSLRGTNGFGYDPCFLIPEYHRTFGELDPIVKFAISHRARAFRKLAPQLAHLLRDP